MATVHSSSTLNHPPLASETFDSTTKLFSLWKLYVHCQESCHNSLACFVYDHTNCTSCNTKQMSYGLVFATGCKTPESDSNPMFHTDTLSLASVLSLDVWTE